MSYWDIRKRHMLNHLPAPDPVLETAGVKDNDPRLAQSREWLRLYHEAKQETENAKRDQDSEREHADASSEGGEDEGRSEALASEGG